MGISEVVKEMSEEIKGQNRKEVIDNYEEKCANDIGELSKNDEFFSFPLPNIFSIISKVDFNTISEEYNAIEILHNLIKNTIKAHFDEKETLLLLQNINTNFSLSFDEIISILVLFTNCPILNQLCRLNEEKLQQLEVDYEYELQTKNNEIEKLKHQITEDYLYIYEDDVFDACKYGDFEVIKWIIEYKYFDISADNFINRDHPIHMACKFDHLPIVQYFIESTNIDVDIKGQGGKTPLHYACEFGNISIIQYLLAKGANINAKEDNYGKTPLHYASYFGKSNYNSSEGQNQHMLQIVECLVSHGADIEAKETLMERTPLHWAAKNGIISLVNFLLSKGANKNAKDINGKTPYEIARNDEIKDLLK